MDSVADPQPRARGTYSQVGGCLFLNALHRVVGAADHIHTAANKVMWTKSAGAGFSQTTATITNCFIRIQHSSTLSTVLRC